METKDKARRDAPSDRDVRLAQASVELLMSGITGTARELAEASRSDGVSVNAIERSISMCYLLAAGDWRWVRRSNAAPFVYRFDSTMMARQPEWTGGTPRTRRDDTVRAAVAFLASAKSERAFTMQRIAKAIGYRGSVSTLGGVLRAADHKDAEFAVYGWYMGLRRGATVGGRATWYVDRSLYTAPAPEPTVEPEPVVMRAIVPLTAASLPPFPPSIESLPTTTKTPTVPWSELIPTCDRYEVVGKNRSGDVVLRAPDGTLGTFLAM